MGGQQDNVLREMRPCGKMRVCIRMFKTRSPYVGGYNCVDSTGAGLSLLKCNRLRTIICHGLRQCSIKVTRSFIGRSISRSAKRAGLPMGFIMRFAN